MVYDRPYGLSVPGPVPGWLDAGPAETRSGLSYPAARAGLAVARGRPGLALARGRLRLRPGPTPARLGLTQFWSQPGP